MMEAFLAREPTAADRIEIAVATLTARFARVHFQGMEAMEAADFLPFLKAWPAAEGERYSDADQAILKVLG